MFQRHTRIKIALAAVLAGALALPGLAAARGDYNRDDGRRGDWNHGRGGHYERDGRGWGHRPEPRYDRWHGHRHHRHHRPDVVWVERPVYRRPYYAPPPLPVPGWGNGVSVILQRSW
jgi:hypothetical protein